MLHEAQQRALAHVAARSVGFDPLGGDFAACLSAIRCHGRVTLNFHPDRLSNGISVAESMLESGVYKSQYETKISNGSVSAYAGGERDGWERKLFGGAYHEPLCLADVRPKYGALNLFDHPHGASPRFGSCYVRLRPSVLSRCTFTFGDSHLAPRYASTLGTFEVMLSALAEAAQENGRALGEDVEDIDALMTKLAERVGPPRPAIGNAVRNLDDYIEAQVHGELRFDRDAEALVLDPSFRESAVGAALIKLAARSEVDIEWHSGFRLLPDAISDTFRGPEMRPLALEICRRSGRDVLDAPLIGQAAASFSEWAMDTWGSDVEVRQLLKKLWHCLLMFGQPI